MLKKITFSAVALSAALLSSSAFAAGTVPNINDYISADTLEPIATSILTVLGVVIASAFTILGFGVAARVGFGVIKSFFSKAAS
ncbi:hypothetical protein J3U31_06505 [Gilliamella sp. B3486]|uniref:hypothetical protein n=1 Tax=unclassified Gilliamella TaxID=2685620 RepID=UPI00226AF811|nr:MULTISPECIES: hypothetical protein [unclassified Gilliamella]MCX8597584.1 hypothetical protein [Gilliamella sp. B3493]MCX8599258.1 hypothetical protein [Gilliamella sp. B3486]MCX8705247.1 hypothetical protein [Gilliamella sp. B3127]